MASVYPLPNGAGNFDNYTSTATASVRDNGFNVRIDHRASDRDSFFVRYSYDKYKLDAPQGQAACCLATPPEAASRFDLGPYVAGIQNTRLTTHGGVLNWTRILSPTVVERVRVGFAKTNPETRQSDFGINAATSLGIQGINVTEFTTGLPNIGIGAAPNATGDLTGISGGPAFLPVNPKQIHYQFEDTLSWVKSAHSFKTGYRFILRKPTPFTNTDTRSSITISRNLTNNPATNSGGSGLATLLLGFATGGARGFLLEPYDLTNSEHSLFVQDDWKLCERLTLNLGLRYEIYVPDTEKDDRLANFDPDGQPAHLCRGGWGDPPRQQADQVGQHRPAPGRGLGRHRRCAQRRPRAAMGRATSRSPLREQPDRPERALRHLPELRERDEPARLHAGPAPVEPVPAHRAGPAANHRRAERGQPSVQGHGFSNDTPNMQTWQVSYERQITNTLMAEAAYVGSKGSNLIWCLNPNEVQPGLGSQASRRLIQPLSNLSNMLQCDPTNRSNYNSAQFKLLKRYSQGLQFLLSYTFGKSLDYAGARPPREEGRWAAPRASPFSTRAADPRASTSSTASS